MVHADIRPGVQRIRILRVDCKSADRYDWNAIAYRRPRWSRTVKICGLENLLAQRRCEAGEGHVGGKLVVWIDYRVTDRIPGQINWIWRREIRASNVC